MGLQQARGTHLPRQINQYVPAMAYAADVVHLGPTRVDFGTPAILDANGILAAVAADDTGPLTYTSADWAAAFNALSSETGKMDALYGRDITAVGSAAGVTQNLTVTGRDYLGQPITKVKAMNGTTPIALSVAFMYVDTILIAVGAASETINVGWGDELGLPFKCIKVLSEELDGVVVGTLGTLTAGTLTDPATNATNDPRGLYNPQSTLDGTAGVTGTFLFDSWVNASNRGGLHGISHFAA